MGNNRRRGRRGLSSAEIEWIKDIVDKCAELGIPVKMQPDIRLIVAASGYEFLEQDLSR